MSLLNGATFILQQSMFMATPLLVAGLGELLAERAGVINIGIEGTMLMGCAAAWAGTVLSGTAWAGIPAAILVAARGVSFALVTIRFRADQIVAGTALNIFAAGGSTTIGAAIQKYSGTPPSIPSLFDPLAIPGLSQIPLIGPALFQQYALFYVVVAAGVVLYIALRFTRFGLTITALGDAPEACDAAGISVRRWRITLVLIAGAASGLAGAYLATMRVHGFNPNMTGGQGFLVLALVIFGRWNIAGLFAGTLLFALLEGLQSYLIAMPGATTTVPHQLFDMLPYVATLVALGLLSRSRSGPIYLGRPWPE